MAASSRSSPPSPPGPCTWASPSILRPTPGGDIDKDVAWAFTNDLYELASTYGWFDGGDAAWFQPIAWIPVPLLLTIAVVVLVWLPFRATVTGRNVYAVGSSEAAAYMSGLAIDRARLAAFTLAGFFAGVGGLYLAIQTSSGNADVPQAGGYTLNSIAAVVIGGTALTGGSGGAFGSLVGALVIRAISFNFRIFDVPPLLQPLFEGLVLLAAVSLGRRAGLPRQEPPAADELSPMLNLSADARPIVIASLFVLVILVLGSGYTLSTQGSLAFLSPVYLLQQLQVGAFLGIVAAGMMLVILLGHIDLSVPWTLAAAAMMATAVGGPLAIPVGLGIGLRSASSTASAWPICGCRR